MNSAHTEWTYTHTHTDTPGHTTANAQAKGHCTCDSGDVGITCEHHHVLNVSSDLVAAAQVEQERQRVDVAGPTDEDGKLPVRKQFRKETGLLPLRITLSQHGHLRITLSQHEHLLLPFPFRSATPHLLRKKSTYLNSITIVQCFIRGNKRIIQLTVSVQNIL